MTPAERRQTLRIVPVTPESDGGGGKIVDRELFRFLVDLEVQKARRLRYSLSLICLEADGADAPLPLPQVVAPQVRSTDAVTVRDGSSVAVLLVDAHKTNVPSIVERLMTAVREVWTAGAACFPETASSAMELVRQAEAMLVQAKGKTGGGLQLAG